MNNINEHDTLLEDDSEFSPDSLLSKISTNDLKNIVKSTGMKLSGNESEEELKGMAKVLASTTESFIKRCNRLNRMIYENKETENRCYSKFLK